MAILDSINQIRFNGSGPLDPDVIVADIDARDAIPSAKLVPGYTVSVADADGEGNPSIFQRNNANDAWVQIQGGSSITSVRTDDTISGNGITTDLSVAYGTTSTTALRGDTALLQIGTTSTTALAGDTTIIQIGTTFGTALDATSTAVLRTPTTNTEDVVVVISSTQVQRPVLLQNLVNPTVLDLTDGDGIVDFTYNGATAATVAVDFGTGVNQVLRGNTPLLQIGTTSTTALAGNTDVDNVDISQYSTSTTIADGDFLLFQDISDSNVPHKITFANLTSGLGGGRGFAVDNTAVGGTGAVDFITDTTNADANNRAIDFHSDNNNQITATVNVAGLGSSYTPNSFTDTAEETLTKDILNTTIGTDVTGFVVTSSSRLGELVGATFDNPNGGATHTVIAANENDNTITFTPALAQNITAGTTITFTIPARLTAARILTSPVGANPNPLRVLSSSDVDLRIDAALAETGQIPSRVNVFNEANNFAFWNGTLTEYNDGTDVTNNSYVFLEEGAVISNTLVQGGGGTSRTVEEIQDIVGGMVTGNTETNINVTYDDTNGKLDFVASGSGSGLLPTTYNYSFNGASDISFLDFWDQGFDSITTGLGAAVPNGTTLESGDTMTIGNSENGRTEIWRYTGADFNFGSNTQIGTPSDLTLLYRFNDGEATGRIQGDKIAEQHINGLTFDTIASQTGIHLDGTGPVGTELIKVSGETALEESVQEIYFTPSSNTITYVLLPDSAVLTNGIWALTDGGSTIADLPDSAGHPLVAAYGAETSPTNETSTFFEGNVLRAHWNGRQFYWVLNITAGVSDIDNIADPADTFGDRDITGIADTTMVLRNVFSIGDTQAGGFLAKNPTNGFYTFQDIVRATQLGVIRTNFTASGLQNVFNSNPQTTEPVTINRLDTEYRVNGFTIRNNEFYAIPGDTRRFHLLSDPGSDNVRGISSTIYFDATFDSVVNNENDVDIDLNIVSLSSGLADSSLDFSGAYWVIAETDFLGLLERPKAPSVGGFDVSYIPELEANQISNFNESVLNIIEHHIDNDWAFTVSQPETGTSEQIRDNILAELIFFWGQADAGGTTQSGNTYSFTPTPTTADFLQHGDTVTVENTNVTGTLAPVTLVYEGRRVQFGGDVLGITATDFAIHQAPSSIPTVLQQPTDDAETIVVPAGGIVNAAADFLFYTNVSGENRDLTSTTDFTEVGGTNVSFGVNRDDLSTGTTVFIVENVPTTMTFPDTPFQVEVGGIARTVSAINVAGIGFGIVQLTLTEAIGTAFTQDTANVVLVQTTAFWEQIRGMATAIDNVSISPDSVTIGGTTDGVFRLEEIHTHVARNTAQGAEVFIPFNSVAGSSSITAANTDLPIDSLTGGETYLVDISGSPDSVLVPGNYLMTLTIGASTSVLSNIRPVLNGNVGDAVSNNANLATESLRMQFYTFHDDDALVIRNTTDSVAVASVNEQNNVFNFAETPTVNGRQLQGVEPQIEWTFGMPVDGDNVVTNQVYPCLMTQRNLTGAGIRLQASHFDIEGIRPSTLYQYNTNNVPPTWDPVTTNATTGGIHLPANFSFVRFGISFNSTGADNFANNTNNILRGVFTAHNNTGSEIFSIDTVTGNPGFAPGSTEYFSPTVELPTEIHYDLREFEGVSYLVHLNGDPDSNVLGGITNITCTVGGIGLTVGSIQGDGEFELSMTQNQINSVITGRAMGAEFINFNFSWTYGGRTHTWEYPVRLITDLATTQTIGDFTIRRGTETGVIPTGSALISVDNVQAVTYAASANANVAGRVDLFSSTTALTTGTNYVLVVDDARTHSQFTTGQRYRISTPSTNAAGSSFSFRLITDGVVGGLVNFSTVSGQNIDYSIFAEGTAPQGLEILNSTGNLIFRLDNSGNLTVAGTVTEGF